MSFYVFCQQGVPITVTSLTSLYLHPYSIYPQPQTIFPLAHFPNDGTFDTNTTLSPVSAIPAQAFVLEAFPFEQMPRQHRNKEVKRRKSGSLKQLESARKNGQSNLVNQLLSFLSNVEKSQKMVRRAIMRLGGEANQQQKIQSIFYNIVRLINYKRGRKYVNRKNVLNFYTPQAFQKQLPQIRERLAETGFISLEQLCQLFRVVSYQYVRELTIPAVLTSKRISVIAKLDHLNRKRRLQGKLRNEFQV